MFVCVSVSFPLSMPVYVTNMFCGICFVESASVSVSAFVSVSVSTSVSVSVSVSWSVYAQLCPPDPINHVCSLTGK